MSHTVVHGALLPWRSPQAHTLSVVDGVIVELEPAPQIAPEPTGEVNGDVVTIDAAGCVLLPAFVDLHTHIREPGATHAETAESASRAAVAGGYVAIHAMANTQPVADTPAAVTAVWERGREIGLVDIRPVGAVTVGLAGQTCAPIEAMHDTEAAPMLFSDDGHCVNRADLMREALRSVSRFGGVIAQHAQDASLTVDAQINEGEISQQLGWRGWPGVAEAAIVARDVLLAADTGARLHICHVSTAATVDVLRWAKSRGLPVTAEVTPHHLVLTDDLAVGANPIFKVNPPLRAAHDVHAVREALADGTIDAVATDHAPHPDEAKTCPWPDAAMGMLGLQTAFSVVHATMVATGLMSWQRLVEAMSWEPSHIGGLRPASLNRGESADFVLINPTEQWLVEPRAMQSLSSNTPFAGQLMSGAVVATVRGGNIIYLDESTRNPQ